MISGPGGTQWELSLPPGALQTSAVTRSSGAVFSVGCESVWDGHCSGSWDASFHLCGTVTLPAQRHWTHASRPLSICAQRPPLWITGILTPTPELPLQHCRFQTDLYLSPDSTTVIWGTVNAARFGGNYVIYSSVYLFILSVLGLCRCVGFSLVAVRRLLIAGASLMQYGL